MTDLRRPYVLINSAATVDGKLDTFKRHGAAISSRRDKDRVDRLRAGADAIMVGGHTLAGDDPKLLVKSPELRAERVAHGMSENPAKVAVATRFNLTPNSQFLNAGPARRILFTTTATGAEQLTLLSELGAEVFLLGDGSVDLEAALHKLWELGIRRLMVEGGGTLNFELLRLGFVDELQLYIAPLIFGGAGAPTFAAGIGLPRDEAIQLQRTGIEIWDDEGGIVLYYTVTRHSNRV